MVLKNKEIHIDIMKGFMACFHLFPSYLCSSYYDQMCGLCGDYDGNPNNDFTKPDGSLVGNVNDFGNSWQTEEDEDDR